MSYLFLALCVPAGVYLFFLTIYLNDRLWERRKRRLLKG